MDSVSRISVRHEYRERHPGGYGYAQFCKHYAHWRGRQDYCMRQVHKGGEKLFVAVWGASNFTFAEASFSQDLPSWIGSHVRAFDFFGCLPGPGSS